MAQYGYAYSNTLVHYGVPGMKWGRRKTYAQKASSHISKIGTSKTRLGKTYHNLAAYNNQAKDNRSKAIARDMMKKKGRTLKTLDNMYGHGANAARQKAASDYYTRKSKYTKTRLGTTSAKSAAYSNKQIAKANTRIHNSKSVREYGKNYYDAYANTPIKTWSGRTTTLGKQAVDNFITGGLAGTAMDAYYYTSHRNRS